MRPKPNMFIVNCEVYNYDVLCWFGDDMDAFYKKLSHYCHFDEMAKIKKYDYGVQGYCMNLQRGDTSVIWMRSLPKENYQIGVLAHEVFHVVHRVMNVVQIPLSYDSEEAWAYLTDFLMTRILRGIDKLKP